MSETVGQWQRRKAAQGERLVERMPGLEISTWGDYRTRFVAVSETGMVVFGQLEREACGQPVIDLTDDQVITAFKEAEADMMRDLPDGNLMQAQLPALQAAVVESIWRKVESMGVKYGFEVTSIERFDNGYRLEVGVKPTGVVIHNGHGKLGNAYFTSVTVADKTVAQIGSELAHAFEDWARKKLGMPAT